MAELAKAPDLKSGFPVSRDWGFESPSLRYAG